MFLKARAYQIGWENKLGKTHKLDPENPDKTLCGKTRATCPGETIEEFGATLDCKSCLSAIESRERQAEWKEKCRIEAEQKQLQTEQWWRWYNDYLSSPEWRRLRKLVIERADGMCEGCGQRACTQVHHLTYDRAGHEMLFDLVAVCDDCHAVIHGTAEQTFHQRTKKCVRLSLKPSSH